MAQFKPLKSETVLVVEDDILVQLELADWLVEVGFTVLTADDADAAIVLLDSNVQIDMLLTDIEMPGSIDGLRLAHHVAKRWPPIRIVVMSGRYLTELGTLPAGSCFIPKPYEPRALLHALTAMASPNVSKLPVTPSVRRAD